MAAKDNVKAAHFRQQGNELYLCGRKKFTYAMKKYNESICWAENDSEDLGIAYANRSAVFLEMGEYEFALANITLAKSHNYPQRMMPKLEARERICRQELCKPVDFGHEYRLEINVEVNPRIPFLANDVHVEEIANVGRRVVADRDFETGDVILQTGLLFGSVAPSMQYLICDNCTSEFLHSLIPCPHCVSVMYCGEDCRQKSWKHFHRFECGISSKLHDVFEATEMTYMGPRSFFYGLGLFDDDVKKMQQFCETHPRTGSNPFTLDYVNYDALEEFKVTHTFKVESNLELPHAVEKRSKAAAEGYFKAFQASPLVKSFFATSAAKKFMQHYFLDYIHAFALCPDTDDVKFTYSAVSMIFANNCSTAGNVAMFNFGGCCTVVVLQAISKGSQLSHKLMDVSDVMSNPMLNVDHSSEFPLMEWRALDNLLHDESIKNTIKITQMHNFMRKYSHLADLRQFKRVAYLNALCMDKIFTRQVVNDMRSKAITRDS